LFFIVLILLSCRVRVIDVSLEDCMKTRPSPYKYDEFVTRYIKANGDRYVIEDTTPVYEISLPKNYDNLLYFYTDGQFDCGLQGNGLHYSYKCSEVYFYSVDVSITQYPDTTYINRCYPFNDRKNTYPFPIMLEGIDSLGLYWKRINYQCEDYGYCNVLKEDKAIFDSIVNSIKRIK